MFIELFCIIISKGKLSSPRELLVLGSLHILTRNVTFDDLQDRTEISREVHRVFFNRFMKWYSDVVFPHFVKLPSLDDLAENGLEYALAGFPGCIGSVDCVHIRLWGVSANLKQMSTGKEKFPSRSFEVSVNHRGMILSATNGFYGSVNDKTIVKFDEAMMAVRKGCYDKNEYAIYSKDGELIYVSGAYFICDNGYHKWPTMMEPTKNSNGDGDVYDWSEMTESLRKDVECTFGILKQEFAILKYGTRFIDLQLVNYIFKTCCAIHNQRKIIKGTDLPWSVNELDGEEGEDGELPDVFKRMAKENEELEREEREAAAAEEQLDPVEVDPTHSTVKQQLITHFKIASQRGAVSWPKRNGIFRRYVPSSKR